MHIHARGEAEQQSAAQSPVLRACALNCDLEAPAAPEGAWNCDLLMWQDYRVDGPYGAIK